MHRTNYLVIFLLFYLSIVGGAKLLAQNTLQKVSLQLKWWHQFQFAGFYAAQQKGFYKEVGLDVSLFESSAANPPLNAVLTNKADFGVVGADLVVNYAKGDPVKVIGAIFQHSPYALLSLPSQKINAPNNLMGKTIMGSPDQGWVQILAMLLAEGIDTTSMKRIDHSWKNEDLINGKTDLITGYSCVEPYQIKKAFGIDVNLLQPINYGIDFYGDVLFCHANLAETNPDLVEKFKKASFKGWEYAMSHKQEIAEYILTLPGVKQRGITIEHLLFEANSMEDLLLPKLVEPGHMNEGRWNHIAGIYKKLNIIPADADISNFIFKEREVSNTETLKKTFIALGCIVFLALVLFAFNIHLSKSVKRRTQELENEIKQREFTEENLKLSEERLALATKAAGIGIWDWQIVENKMYYSPQVKTMLGYAPNELEDSISTFSLLLHPNHNQEIIQKLNDHIYNKKDTYEAIVQLRTKENDYKWILISSKAISRDEQGRALRLTGIHLDVDKLKKKEIQLSELTDELMHSNNELRQFAYITSHNLRAPVANMLSLLALFEKGQLADMNAVLFEKLDWSIKKLDDTLKDLNEILSSRVSKAVTVTNIDFKELIDNCCKSLSEDIKSANANINIQLAVTNIPYSQKVLQSVMQNLMTNAIKYRRKDVPLSITISTEWQDKNVLLSFRDNGIGIDLKKYGNKIFGLYQRFNTDIEGKGMGLFIVKNQIEALHGSIKISSEPLKGTCFQLLLVPLTQKG